MRRWGLALVVVCILRTAARADEPIRIRSAAVPSTSGARPTERLEHLRRAAEHLEAVGLTELAGTVREQAYCERVRLDELLQQKIERLAALQVEVAALRRATGDVQQVLFSIDVLEFSRGKPNADAEPRVATAIENWLEGNSKPWVLSNDASLVEELRKLQSEGLVKVLAEPRLVTVNGRPARLRIGGEIPVAVAQSLGMRPMVYRHVGTELDLVPTVMVGGRIRFAFRARVSSADDKRSVIVDGFATPGLRVREVETSAELQSGESLLIAAVTQRETGTGAPATPDVAVADQPAPVDETNDVQVLFVVTPELIREENSGSILDRHDFYIRAATNGSR